MKTSALIGEQLDYWVARAEGYQLKFYENAGWYYSPDEGKTNFRLAAFAPSRNWATAGPIIERESIGIAKYASVRTDGQPRTEFFALSYAASFEDSMRADGPTMLIAAMRCYVASKYGYEVPDA